MYKKILVALENSEVDQELLPHVEELARFTESAIILMHVADGWVARSYTEFQQGLGLNESEEMKTDREYLNTIARDMRSKGFSVKTFLALGNPPEEIIKEAENEKCDLIAMTSHGHHFWGHLLYGSTIDEVRDQSKIPILIVRSLKKLP
jgi:nucleotide-binding universal stress UspA family protein